MKDNPPSIDEALAGIRCLVCNKLVYDWSLMGEWCEKHQPSKAKLKEYFKEFYL